MNRTSLVIPGIIVCLVAAGAICLGYNAVQEPEAKTAGYFTGYVKNPAIKAGAKGSWDSSYSFWSTVVAKDGVYYLFYSGASSAASRTVIPYNLSIGYAASNDSARAKA